MKINVLASGSTGNCYHVTDGDHSLLLECGIPFKKIQQGIDFKVSALDGVLVSHCHGDHAKAAKDIVKAGITVYGSMGTIGALGLTGHHRAYGINANDVQSQRVTKVGPWSVLAFPTEHDAVDPCGFLIDSPSGERLLYLTDSYYVRFRFARLNTIMIECNYSLDILDRNVAAGRIVPELRDRIIKSHFSLENVIEALKANDLSRVKAIYLLHLSSSNSDEVRFKREIQKIAPIPVYVC